MVMDSKFQPLQIFTIRLPPNLKLIINRNQNYFMLSCVYYQSYNYNYSNFSRILTIFTVICNYITSITNVFDPGPIQIL